MKTLVLAEKESQAKDLSKGLAKYGEFKNGDRYMENNRFIITWAQGHVLSLMEPRDYENWGDRKWELQALPWYPPANKFTYKIGEKTKRVYDKLKPIFKRSDIGEIVVATDAGREGTLIAQELIDHFGMKVPVKRFYESAVLTPENVQRIIETDLKGDDFHKPRAMASYARSYADLLLGMNFTIGFSAKTGRFISMGRVQTPTMAILAQRKQEILNFKEETYYEMEAEFGNTYKGLWFKEQLSNTRFKTIDEINQVKGKIQGKNGVITKKEVKEQLEHPDFLYNMTSLQQHASKKFDFDPDRTLEIAQELYDKHKILSYPRTSSKVIGTAHVPSLKGILEAIRIDQYQEFVNKVLDDGIKTTKRLVNDKELSDHHAIIPTNVAPDLSKLTADERKIYDLVVKRFLSAFYPAAVYEKTEIVTEVEGETFKTSGKVEKSKGWKVVYGNESESEEEDDGKEKESTIPPIEKGEERAVGSISEKEKRTQAPKPYDFAKLLAAMENPKRFLQTQELKEALDSAEATAGLGTEATRSALLKELLNREYIVKKGKSLDITDIGMKIVEVSPEKLKSPEITAEWEGKLRKMELGEYDFNVFMDEIYTYIESVLDELKNSEMTVVFPQRGGGEEIAKCPICAESIRERKFNFACDTHSAENPCFSVNKEIAKKKITEAIVKELAAKGITKTIKGFVGGKGKFDAPLKIDDNRKVVFHFEDGSDKVIANCPYCNSDIKERRFNYSCETHSNETPCFSVNKEIAKKAISESVVKELAEKGITKEIKGFTGGKGKFDAPLKLDEKKKVVFAFESKPKVESQKTDIICPFCNKGHIQENAKAFGCSNWKECKFTVWKNGNVITLDVIKTLVSKGETGRLDGLKSSKGSVYSVNYKLDVNAKKIDTEFLK